MVEKKTEEAPKKVEETPKKAGGSKEESEGRMLSAIGYIIPLIAIIAYFIKKDDRFVRFHGLQSIFTWLAYVVIFVLLGAISGILAFIPIVQVLVMPLSCLVFVGAFAAFIYVLFLAWKSFQGEMVMVPVLGDWAEKYA